MTSYPLGKSSIIVQAGMGVGKSKQESIYLKSLTERYGEDKMIVVKLSHRKAFTAQEVKRLNEETGLPFVSHDDVVGQEISLSTNPFLVIQYESLHRILNQWGLHGRKLVLLCDEWNSILRQMESKAGVPGDDMVAFQTLVKFSSHSVFMDACTNVNSVEACQSFLRDAGKEMPHMIINTYQKHKDNGTELIPYVDDQCLLAELHSTLRNGKKAVVVTHSKETANRIYYGIEERFPDKKVKVYTGETSAETKMEDFRDVNETWKDMDVIIYNSTCEAGISCILAEFEDVFAFFSQEIVCVQASFQMVGRIRAMQRLHVHVYCPPQSLKYIEAHPIDRDAIFKEYTSGRRAIPDELKAARRFTENGWTIDGTPFGNVLYANIRHRNASKRDFKHLFFELCKASGMTLKKTVHLSIPKDKELMLAVETRGTEAREIRAQEIADAPQIGQDESDILKLCKVKSQEQSDSLAKFFLSARYKVSQCDVDKEFVLQFNNEHTKNAYRAQCSLQMYGNDAPSSIERMKTSQREEVDHSSIDRTANIALHVTSNGVQNAGENAVQRYWHEVSTEEWRSHQVVQELLVFATGLSGLHVADNPETATVSAEHIRELLGYPAPIRGPRGGLVKSSKKGQASPEAVERLQKICGDLQKYLPTYKIKPFTNDVTIKRVVRALNTVLHAMYGCSFTLNEDKSTYTLKQSELFNGTQIVTLPSWGNLAKRKEQEEIADAERERRAKQREQSEKLAAEEKLKREILEAEEKQRLDEVEASQPQNMELAATWEKLRQERKTAHAKKMQAQNVKRAASEKKRQTKLAAQSASAEHFRTKHFIGNNIGSLVFIQCEHCSKTTYFTGTANCIPEVDALIPGSSYRTDVLLRTKEGVATHAIKMHNIRSICDAERRFCNDNNIVIIEISVDDIDNAIEQLSESGDRQLVVRPGGSV